MKKSPPLDAMLTPKEAAEWLGISAQTVMRKSKGRNPKLPAFRIGRTTPRFHVRTIIAKLASDAGVSRDVVNNSMQKK